MSTKPNSPLQLAALAALGLGVAVMIWSLNRDRTSAPQPAEAPVAAAAEPTPAAPAPQQPAPAAPVTAGAAALSQPGGKTFATEPGPSPDAPKPTTGYRPATYLRFSSGEPAPSAAGDASHPTLQRMFEVTGADGAQRAQMRDLWTAHEDGRRALWATAYPRVSGPRMLDREALRKLDAALRAALGGVLRPDQQEKLLQELPPSSQEPQTQEIYDEPRQP